MLSFSCLFPDGYWEKGVDYAIYSRFFRGSDLAILFLGNFDQLVLRTWKVG